MPELPDVEVFTRYFRRTALYKKVAAVRVPDARIIKGMSPRALKTSLAGAWFVAIQRHGKYLFAKTDKDKYLMLHFGMTGSLRYYRQGGAPSFTKFLINFKDGSHLAFADPRLFGKVTIIGSPAEFIKKQKLGPDALAIDFETFRSIFKKSSAVVKAEFLRQNRIAGIGNIYADEILFQSRVHPATRCSSLSEEALKIIFRNMKKVLAVAIHHNARPLDLPGTYLLPHREKNGQCPRSCGSLATVIIGGRTTYFCPKCQILQKASRMRRTKVI